MKSKLSGKPLELLSIPEFARAAGISVARLQSLIDQDRIRHFRFGKDEEIIRLLRLDLSQVPQALDGAK